MKLGLTEKQEILLCRLFDGDLGLFNRMRAKRLVRSNGTAQDFLTSLESISSAVTAPQIDGSTKKCDLWDEISQRIEAEERAAIFLGARQSSSAAVIANSDHEEHSTWYRFFSTQALLGGLSGAATTAVVLFVVSSMRATLPGGVVTASNSNSGASSPQVLTQASLSSNGFENSRGPYSSAIAGALPASSNRPTLLNGRDRAIMEVDWMRGNGPLRVIQNPSERSTIIWVKRQGNDRVGSRKSPQIGRGGGQRLPQLVLTQAPSLSNESGVVVSR